MATVKEIVRKRTTAYQIEYRLNTKRCYLSLGSKYDRSEAYEIAANVDRLTLALEVGRPVDARTTRWLEGIPVDLQERLARAGLVEIEKIATLEEIVDAYWEAEYYEMKPSTQSSKRQSRRRLFEFFEESRPAASITKQDAARFVSYLKTQMSEATRAGIVRDVRRIFNWAKDAGLTRENPFDGIRRGSFQNKTREYYVSLDDYEKMLEASPTQMWRTVLALYRIGGLRYEEALRVEWRDVDFVGRRMLVHSPKTERYRGRESRVIPLFPELYMELEAQWDETPAGGSPYVISENRSTIRKHVDRIVFLAGLNRWERLIQNLRSSRAIEIARDFGELAESEWIGHSPQTARDHYLHLLDADFARAAGTARDENPGRFSSSGETTVKTTVTGPAN